VLDARVKNESTRADANKKRGECTVVDVVTFGSSRLTRSPLPTRGARRPFRQGGIRRTIRAFRADYTHDYALKKWIRLTGPCCVRGSRRGRSTRCAEAKQTTTRSTDMRVRTVRYRRRLAGRGSKAPPEQ